MQPECPMSVANNGDTQKILESYFKTMRGNISYGDGTNPDNINGAWGSDGTANDYITTPGVANTEFAVTHNLGVIPKAYAVKYQDKNAVFYDSGGTAWDTTKIYLKCSAATVKVRIFVLGY